MAVVLLGVLPGAALHAQDDGAALTLAEQAAAGGDMAEVRRLLAGTFGPEVATLPAAAPPRASQALLDITTRPGERIYEMHLPAASETGAPGPLVEEVAAAISGTAWTQASGDRLTIRLPYSDTAHLQAQQDRVRAALPARPELALLAAALTPATLEWRAEALPFADAATYREEVNLGPVTAACEGRAALLDAAAATAAGVNDRLPQVQAQLWTADAAAWRAFCTRSRATYYAQLSAERPARRWEVAAGTSRLLEAEARTWRFERLAWLAAGAVLLIVLFVAALWRLGVRTTPALTTEDTEHAEDETYL